MPLANNALVLVTDGRKTLFFRNHGDENQIDLRTEAYRRAAGCQGPRTQDRRAGPIAQSAGFGRSTYEETDFHQQEEDRWALDRRGRGQQAGLAMTSTRWRSSPRPRRSASSARNCTRRPSGGWCAKFPRK